MAPLTDPVLLALFREALAEWKIAGFVECNRIPYDWLRLHLPAVSRQAVAAAMYQHVLMGGVIDQVRERRELHEDQSEFHFDFRLTIAGRKLYIETILDENNTGPTVTIVSIHDE